MLTLHVERSAAALALPVDESSSLHGQLFAALAHASGLLPQRLVVGDTITLMLGFVPATGADASLAPSAALLPRTPVAAGRCVLLLEPREMPRLQAHQLMRAAGMFVDATASLLQARSALHDHAPDALVTGLSSGDAGCAALIDELRILQPRLRVVELVDDDSAFALSSPRAGQSGQRWQGRHVAHARHAVSQELDAAWEAWV